jgi:hypothetical protein
MAGSKIKKASWLYGGSWQQGKIVNNSYIKIGDSKNSVDILKRNE